MKINVVGTSGSGKSTLSKRLAEALDVPHIALDQLFWRPNWQETPDDEFFPKVEAALVDAVDGWVLDGNFNRTRAIKWREVDMIVWLDYGFWRTFRQSLQRAIVRIVTRRELWPGTGNRETVRKTFLSRDSILLWMLTYWRPQRRRYLLDTLNPAYRSIQIVRLTHPDEANLLIEQLAKRRG
ncbi:MULTISPECIES: AAA family ATPase [unclassified Halomonas]|uniref:AAA family ATPase n=1 Tax=unclassified Halomonas TaxID=2609666 RepID=UPI00209EA6C8|nr:MULTISPECIES: AAA family ATPase [unclassified Halomonas]MCP1315982.1 adenylate kinase [Halomonas sp. 707D7]MCP1325198.1 adenylate kinase [Halomonas sp. 707D4]